MRDDALFCLLGFFPGWSSFSKFWGISFNSTHLSRFWSFSNFSDRVIRYPSKTLPWFRHCVHVLHLLFPSKNLLVSKAQNIIFLLAKNSFFSSFWTKNTISDSIFLNWRISSLIKKNCTKSSLTFSSQNLAKSKSNPKIKIYIIFAP